MIDFYELKPLIQVNKGGRSYFNFSSVALENKIISTLLLPENIVTLLKSDIKPTHFTSMARERITTEIYDFYRKYGCAPTIEDLDQLKVKMCGKSQILNETIPDIIHKCFLVESPKDHTLRFLIDEFKILLNMRECHRVFSEHIDTILLNPSLKKDKVVTTLMCDIIDDFMSMAQCKTSLTPQKLWNKINKLNKLIGGTDAEN